MALSPDDRDNLSSPTSPTFSNSQQLARPYPNVRGHIPAFPSTPTTQAFAPPPLNRTSLVLDAPAGVDYHDYISSWTDDHVARWLTDIKCSAHIATFKANDIRGDVLLELDQDTLKEMGVASIGDRLRMINAVKGLRSKSAGSRLNLITKSHSRTNSEQHSPTGSSRLNRRLEQGRPAPLQLNSANGGALPSIARAISGDAPDSARPSTSANSQNGNASNASNNPRPLPYPSAGSLNSSTTSTATPTSVASSVSNGSSQSSARSNLPPLPPAPRSQPPMPPPTRAPVRGNARVSASLNSGSVNGRRTPTTGGSETYVIPNERGTSLLTPGPGTASGTWTGYGLPTNPRPMNQQGGDRAISPLQITRNTNRLNGAHGRNTSVTSPNLGSPANRNNYPAGAGNGLSIPISLRPNLSPVEEVFGYSLGGSTSPPNSGGPNSYAVGRGPFGRPSTPLALSPADDIRRKLVKFLLPEEGYSSMINVADCPGGVEVLEKVLKKFGKSRGPGEDMTDYVQATPEGGFSVDGWAVYWGPGDGHAGEALSEAELMSICHAPMDHPVREQGLTVRRTVKPKRSKVFQILGESLPISQQRRSPSPSSPSRSYQEFYNEYNDGTLSIGPTPKSTKRASSISILSGLGVRDPERALEPMSPTTPNANGQTPLQSAISAVEFRKPSKLRNFFGQRPPSELITTHLTEYFPNTEKKVLERTARHSMMIRGRRDSSMSIMPLPPMPRSGTVSRRMSRMSMSSTRSGASSIAPPVPEKGYNASQEDIPRMSLSTEDGRSVDLHGDDDSDRSEFSKSMDSLNGVGRSLSRTSSIASKRISAITELRSKSDRSDTASMMTMDEITAEVESRRESVEIERDIEGWTEVSSPGEDSIVPVDIAEATLAEEVPVDDDEGLISDEEDEDLEPDSRSAAKWIKGALIGAGSFGKVYLGMDADSGTLMAVKQVELPTEGPNTERKKSMLTALELEIELLKDLQHENIVQYLYSSLDDEFLNIFLEYVPGGSVTALLSNYGAFEETLTKNFVRQILQGLDYLHERNIIHRDIKGANILVDNKGGIKISDFGISKKINNESGKAAHRASLQGSVFWMAPEVVKQTGHTRAADIWSVGCVIVEMLTGEHPWAQLNQMQAMFKIGSSAKPVIPTDISTEAQDFLAKTFELKVEARPSAKELLGHAWMAVKKPGRAAAKAANAN